MTADPGIALRTTRLGEALALLQPALRADFTGAAAAPHPTTPTEEPEAIEEACAPAGFRSRRILLDGAWWRGSGAPMLARVTDRRAAPRPDDAALAQSPFAWGWVALLPRAMGGYVARAHRPGGGEAYEWKVDAAVAARLAPFAYTFHRTFAHRALGALDVVRFALDGDFRDAGFVLLAGLAAAMVGILTPIATARLIDHAIPTGDLGAIGRMMLGLAVAGLALVALEWLCDIATLRFEGRTGVGVQAAVIDRLVSAPTRFFRAFSSGDLALRLGAIDGVQGAVSAAFVSAIVAGLFVAANLALMIAYSGALTVAALAIVAATAALSTAIGIVRLRLGRRIEALDGRIGALSFEYLSGIAKLRAAAAEPRAFANWIGAYDRRQGLRLRSARAANFETVVMGFLQPAATLAVLLLAWRIMASPAAAGERAALTPGMFVAFHTAMFALLGGVHELVATAIGLLDLKPQWERARPLLETLPEGAGEGRIRHDPRGAIALEGVCFSYPGGPEVLSDIDLAIRPGEYVAIVGPSGSGKSTLARLLLGFETASRGVVRYDGLDVRTLELARLRRGIGTVLQGGKLWAGDLATNILGAAQLPPEAAWDAARAAGLAEDIEAMPMGMYTVVGEGLSTLSGGQRQRVLIARALVAKPAILLLDEATSALDNVSQAAVLSSLGSLNSTRIVIAHRLGAVRGADRIVVLEAGRIVEQGGFEELAGASGPFARMLERQR